MGRRDEEKLGEKRKVHAARAPAAGFTFLPDDTAQQRKKKQHSSAGGEPEQPSNTSTSSSSSVKAGKQQQEVGTYTPTLLSEEQ